MRSRSWVDIYFQLNSDLSGKQNALNTSQLNAVNSGITSALVSQITTNKNGIANRYTKTETNNLLNNKVSCILGSDAFYNAQSLTLGFNPNDGGFSIAMHFDNNTSAVLWWNNNSIAYDYYNGSQWNRFWTK